MLEAHSAQPTLLVDLGVKQSVWGNIKHYHDQRREIMARRDRMVEVNAQRARRAARQQAHAAHSDVLGAGGAGALGQPVVGPVTRRSPFWFERFYWFVSSENLLVLAGRKSTRTSSWSGGSWSLATCSCTRTCMARRPAWSRAARARQGLRRAPSR